MESPDYHDAYNYEMMYIVNPELGSETIGDLAQLYRELVEQVGGDVQSVDDWGMRRLAYEIDDYTEGHYVLMKFSATNERITSELQRRMRMDERVMRNMIFRIDE